MGRRSLHIRRSRSGFTLLEILIATALLAFSLIVMFGFHTQASISNKHARKITDCTYLAQNKMEELLSLRWTEASRPSSIVDGMDDPTSSTDNWAWLELPSSGAQPIGVNAAGNSDTTYGQPDYFITWDARDMDLDGTWVRLRVRCSYLDQQFNTWRGTTISSFKFRDQ